MQDLSSLLRPDPVSALVPTSQAAGNATSSNEAAGTAPGSLPVDPLPDRDEQSDPSVDATAYDGRHLVRGGGES
jgi:hypothetical protein